jgi:LytS/YehU family sensor histidine kinase
MQTDQIELVLFGSIVPLIIVFIFLFFVIYRSRREAAFRKREFDLELSRSNMEMRALRSQVNPHFIFNCLASIQNFIGREDTSQAEYYLVKFSSLIRQVLENSTEKMVSLSDDLDALLKYVDMEKLRLSGQFDFELETDDQIIADETFVPPLIIQPLVENAIWHGANDSAEKGLISVKIEVNDSESLICSVKNLGKGVPVKKKVAEYKKKSLGLSLIRERVELLNGLYNRSDEVTISDVSDQSGNFGKEVKIVVPCEL